jgi:hypothetical protein
MGHGFADKVARSVTLPFDVMRKSDPLMQFVTNGKADFNADHNLDAGLKAAYKDDPVGNSLLTETDYTRAGKVAAAAAAIYFTGGAALNAMGGEGAGAGIAGAEGGLGAAGAGELTAADMALEAGVGGATVAGAGSTAAEIAAAQGVGGSAAGLRCWCRG